MITEKGEKDLRAFAKAAYPRKRYDINERIFYFVGYGHSNCTVIEGNTSLILIDTLDTDERAQKVREEMEGLTGKTVKTIIYTHGHPDHRNGAGAFRSTAEEVIAFVPRRGMLAHTERISDILGTRMARQFGYELSDEEVITQGIGIREGFTCAEGRRDTLAPTTLYRGVAVDRVIDGVSIRMVSAVGETDDQIFVWLPDDKVLCCGDNYYACWPNLYAIRGGQYRDVAQWVESLRAMLSYPAETLLPGHTNPVMGYEKIQEVLGNYGDAIEWVLINTLDGINRGMTEDETVRQVVLPDCYRQKSYLKEYYGTVAWSVRAIYQGYLGWFDGNPTNLNPLPPKDSAANMIALIGGIDQVKTAIKTAVLAGNYQWALQLCDIVLYVEDSPEVKQLKYDSLMALSKVVVNANARHYYIACAKGVWDNK